MSGIRRRNLPRPEFTRVLFSARRVAIASNVPGYYTGMLFLSIEHAGCESFRQDRPENGSDQHQDEHYVEHFFIQHPLTVGVNRMIGDKCCGERGSDLW